MEKLEKECLENYGPNTAIVYQLEPKNRKAFIMKLLTTGEEIKVFRYKFNNIIPDMLTKNFSIVVIEYVLDNLTNNFKLIITGVHRNVKFLPYLPPIFY